MTIKPVKTRRYTRLRPLEGPSSVATFLLFVLVLVIGISPRISLGFIDAEIRIQDVLIAPVILYLLLSKKPETTWPIQRLLGKSLTFFLVASFFVVLISMVAMPEVPELRRITYYGRTVEMIVLATVVAGLYLRAGNKAIRTILSAVSLGAVMNLIWFGYQVAAGARQTLFGQEFSSQISSYGPQLIGEPSAFGVGQYWAFIGAVAVARIKSNNRPVFSTLILSGAFYGAWLAESRISVGSILVIIGVALVLGKTKRQSINFLGALTGIIVAVIGALQILPTLDGRVSPDAIVRSFMFRVESIWQPFIDVILGSPFIGIGPGGLLGTAYLGEAHNIFIRAMLDFGIIVGLVFIFLFFRSMARGFKLARTDNVNTTTRLAGYIGAYCVLSALVSGQVQDALTAVMSSHLTMVAIGILAAQRAIYLDNPEAATVKDEPAEQKSKKSKRNKRHKARTM